MDVGDASKLQSPCYLVIDRVDAAGTLKATSLWEYVKVTNIATNTLTITRAQGGSTGQAHSSGAVVEAVSTAALQEEYFAALDPEHTSTGGHVISTPTITSPTFLGTIDGWISANETWTYASATTITVPSGAASKYQKGDKFKLTANSVVLQGYIVGVADTVLTVVGDALTNHTFTANYYSKAENPQGFPDWFNYTPTLTDGADLSGFTIAQFSLKGKVCFLNFIADAKNVTTSGTVQITLPIAHKSGKAYLVTSQLHDGSAWIGNTHCFVTGEHINVYKTAAAGGWTGTETGVYIRLSSFYEIN